MREARTEKVLVLGIDGLDPKMVRKFIDAGRMPNMPNKGRRQKISSC